MGAEASHWGSNNSTRYHQYLDLLCLKTKSKKLRPTCEEEKGIVLFTQSSVLKLLTI